MEFSKSKIELIQKRFSCRTYSHQILDENTLKQLDDFIASLQGAPFGSQTHFQIEAAKNKDYYELKRLGTYGLIKDAPAFIIGVTGEGQRNFEDFGFLMEYIILFATSLDLGTCWLGGTFTRSTFAKRVSIRENELIPAVTAIGHPGPKPRKIDKAIRQFARSDQRLPWNQLFFDTNFGNPLDIPKMSNFTIPLEMVRLGPSASNRQPWRIIKDGNVWHFFLKRTPGYQNKRTSSLLNTVDLQRVDMGIAMCHFELSAHQMGLIGSWECLDPKLIPPDQMTEYLVSWVN